MYKVKIFGAGSIGNHLAYACRTKGWHVAMCDIDRDAMERTRAEIYPSRYGKWDGEIRLAAPNEFENEDFDLVIIGTPPDSHMTIACEELRRKPPRVLLIEKPVCTPSLEDANKLVKLQKETGTFVAVGYNHTLTPHSLRAEEIIREGMVGKTVTISAAFREYWGGIFGAHPWLSGPEDSYLGFSQRGGGAGGEHSHATNIWQHFAGLTGSGRINRVMAMLDMVDDGKVRYDQLFLVNVQTDKGIVGSIIQDVVTEPPVKAARIQGEDGFIEWTVNFDSSHDALRYAGGEGKICEELFPKTRPDDFAGEIAHIDEILQGGPIDNSPIAVTRGLDTMLVVSAAYLSHRYGRTVKINYDAGYNLDALEID